MESIFSNYIATTKSRLAIQEKNAKARRHFLQRLNTLDSSHQTDQEQPPVENAVESSIEETDRFESRKNESGIKKLSTGFRHREQSSARSHSAQDQRIPDQKVTKSKSSKFGWYKKLKDWYSWKLVEYKESWEEVKENPDYAHYVARRFDFYTALITFVAFNVVAILLLAIQSQEQPVIYYG